MLRRPTQPRPFNRPRALRHCVDLPRRLASSFSIATTLQAHVRSGNLDACDAQLRAAEDDARKLHPRVWEALIDACARQGDAGRATSYFERMQRDGGVPERRSYAAMIQLHARRGAADEAQAYWEEMSLRGIEPDPLAFASLIGALGRRGRAIEAERLYLTAAERGTRPSAGVLYALIGAFGRSGALEKMQEYHALLARLGFDTDAAPAFSALIAGYCAAGELQSAIRVYSAAVAKGVTLDGSALSALIRLAVRLQQAPAAHAQGLRPALDTFVALLSACAKDGRTEQAAALFASLPHWHLRANRAVYTALLEGNARSGLAVQSEELLQQMSSEGFEPDSRVPSLLAEAHANDGNLTRATAYLQQLCAFAHPVLPSALAAYERTAGALGDHKRIKWLTAYRAASRNQ